jgi:hypothetical protein
MSRSDQEPIWQEDSIENSMFDWQIQTRCKLIESDLLEQEHFFSKIHFLRRWFLNTTWKSCFGHYAVLPLNRRYKEFETIPFTILIEVDGKVFVHAR